MPVGLGVADERAERAAWAIAPGSSRRFFEGIAVTVFLVVVAASALAATAATRNATVTAHARARGLRVAESVTRFRNHLSLADAEVATTLVTGHEANALGHARYEAELLAASLSLTDAGLVATGRNAEDISTLAEGLVRYAGLVETSRAYPVGSTFHTLARDQVREVLVPTADRVRRAAEDEVGAATGAATGRWVAVALLGLALAVVVLAAAMMLVAGRTRIRLHPVLAVALVGLVVELLLVGRGLTSQRHELRSAARDEIAGFVAADAAAGGLFDLRGEQASALVAAANGRSDPYDEFRSAAADLEAQLGAGGARPVGLRTLRPAVSAYIDSVDQVAALDAQGDHDEAVSRTVDGSSAIAYRTARRLAVSTVNRATRDLEVRLDDAADAGVAWPLPLGLGGALGLLAAGGVLRRGWDYR